MAIPYVPHSTYDEFRAATLGRAYDMDGYPSSQPYQCWDYVDLLYQQSDVNQYLSTANTGNVKDCWLNASARASNGSGSFIAVEGVTNIKRGDIIVFNTYGGWYGSTGHIGFADEDYNGTNTISLLSQNFGSGSNPTTGKPFNIMNAYLGTAFLGVFRYDEWQEPTPPTPTATRKHKFPWAVAWQNWY